MASKREIAENYIFQAFLINSLSVLIRQQKEQVRNRVPVLFVHFLLFGSNRIAIMIRDVYRSCLHDAVVKTARETRDLAERQRG